MTVWDQNGMREVIYYERSHLQLDQMPCHILYSVDYAHPSGAYREISALCAFFMGLLLMVMLITPMLSILEKAKTLPESFSSLYQQEEKSGSLLIWKIFRKAFWKKVWRSSLRKIFWNL